MNRSKFTIFSLIIILFAVSAPIVHAQHWNIRDRAESNMSVLVSEAVIGEESLVEGDEIGVFTPDGFLGGLGLVTDEGLPGISVLSNDAEDGDDPNGFENNEAVSFRFWDSDAEQELVANITRIEDFGGELDEIVYGADDFYIVWLSGVVGPAEIELMEDSHDFGDVIEGRSANWDLIIRNVGGSDLEVASVTLADDEGAFDIEAADEAVVVRSGQSYIVPVNFNPDDIRDYEAVITITSDDPDEEDQELMVTLTGAGVEAPPPNIVLSVNQHDFGAVLAPHDDVEGGDRSWALRITNDGGSTLTIDGVESDNEVFTTDFEDAIDVEPGANSAILVTFTPAAVDNYAGNLTISSNDPDGDIDVRLIGEGVVEGVSDLMIDGLDPDEGYSYFFGSVGVGEMGMWEMVIRNHEDASGDLHLYGISFDSESFMSDFNLDDVRLRPGDFHAVEVTFSPDAEDYYESVMTIESNDPEGDVMVEVAGIGTDDEIDEHFNYFITNSNHSLLVESVELDGESLTAGDEVGVFTESGLCAGNGVVQDDGELGMRAGVTAWADDANSDITDGFVEDEMFHFILWDADADMEVDVEEDGVEFVEGAEVFTTDAFTRLTLSADSPEDPPIIELSSMEHFFGQVVVDESEDWVFMISNMGATDLIVQPIDSDLEEFVTDFGDEARTIAPDESIEITATFAPVNEAQFEGRMTITSNDPENGTLYLDLYGQGVLEVNEQSLLTDEENYFFGAVGVGRMAEYTLTINNGGGGELVIFDILYDGHEEITTDFGGRRRIEGGGSSDLILVFEPNEQRSYHTTLTFQWNDPENENFGEIEFDIWGDGQDSEDHFLERETDSNHSLLVQGAYWVVGERETALIAGDEIGVFTPAGLCAGHAVVEAPGEDIGIPVFGNDGNNEYVDGFQNGEEFMFIFYDFGNDEEVVVDDVRYTEGPEDFTANELTTLELRTEGREEAQIVVDPTDYFFGPSGFNLEEPLSTIFEVSNSGEVALTVQDVESDLQVFTHDFDGEVELQPGESFDLMVTFNPVARQVYVGNITITSSDPDEGEYVFHPSGMGAVAEFEGQHYRAFETDRNHSILMSNLVFGDVPAQPGDEVGVFTESGFLAGRGVVEDPGEVGIAAYGDDRQGPEGVTEGFVEDEAITFHFWDASQSREYIQGDEAIEGLPDDPVTWEVDAFTVFEDEIRIGGIIGIVVENLEEDGYFEDDENGVTFNLSLSGDLDNAQWEYHPPEEDLVPNDVDWDPDNQTFVWHIDYSTVMDEESEDFGLDFSVSGSVDGVDIVERSTVVVTVVNVDREIEPVEGVALEEITILEDQAPEDQDPGSWDLNEWFNDPDSPDDPLYIFRLSAVPEGVIFVDTDSDEDVPNIMTITPQPDMFGDVTVTLRVDLDNQGRDMNLPEFVRVARSVRNDGPRRDPGRDVLDYEFVVHVTGINDPPMGDMIDDEEFGDDREAARAGDEGDLIEFVLTGDDSDTDPEDLTWEMTALDGLAGAAGDYFTDNGDGTGTFSWQTADGDDGVYNTEYTISDGEGDDVVTVIITVNDVPHAPIIVRIENDDIAVDQATYDVAAQEGVEIDLTFAADDADGDQLVWWTDPDNPWNIDQNSGQFTWTPGFDAFSDDPYVVTVFVGDGELTDEIDLMITVENVNRDPEVAEDGAIADQEIMEDSEFMDDGNLVDANIFDNFTDLDLNIDDQLTITVDAPDELQFDQGSLDQGILRIEPTDMHFFQLDPALVVTVTATDLANASVSFDFNVTITPVNDAPMGFDLLTPQDQFQLSPDDNMLDFTWDAAEHDFFGEDDQVITYSVVFTVDGGDSTVISDLANNEYLDMNVDDMLAELELDRSMLHTVTWKVYAMDDGDPMGIAMSNAEFGFDVLSGVNEFENGIPTEYYMTGSYPNPFNETTTIKYGLPAPGKVELSVWDMHGRKIAELASGNHAAGSYEAIWSAQGVTSGVYFIRIQAENYQAMRKAILLR